MNHLVISSFRKVPYWALMSMEIKRSGMEEVTSCFTVLPPVKGRRLRNKTSQTYDWF